MRRKVITPQMASIALAEHARGKDVPDIAERFNVSRQALLRAMKRQRAKVRGRN